ncbi:MAG: Mur ligase family protein [Clostridia bacterium]|nr:Mur ligase family protein [Clostridia bacterium]
MKLFLALILCKLTHFLLRLFGRGGTALPGKVALRICPDMLPRLSGNVKTVLITGTNGKTTTSRMTEKMIGDAGYSYFANRSGSNLERGIAAEFAANSTIFGKLKREYAVIECDEAAFRTVAGKINPVAVVVTNVFRDQLDRYGEVTHTLENIREGIKKIPGAVLCLNADCSLTASLADDVPNELRLFGMDVALENGAEVSDAPRCIRCGARYEYDYRTFAHLGSFKCPDCGYKRRNPAVSVARVQAFLQEGSQVDFRLDGELYPGYVGLPAAYNLYNAAAAVAAATAMGVPADDAVASLAEVKSGFGRMESFMLGDVRVKVILVKNPAGCDRALDYLAGLRGDFTAAFCLNDNLADGTDVSWIWDAGFERLFANGPRPKLIVSGTRAEDMRLRLKYAGADENMVRLIRSDAELIQSAAQSKTPVYIMPTYTAMLPLRHELMRLCGGRKFWE